MEMYLASGNEHKREEFTRILSNHTIVLPCDRDICFDVEETGATFLQNALLKAEALYNAVHAPVIADDSGLCIDALNGAPGIYSARYGGGNGLLLSAQDRNRLVLQKMLGIQNRSCRFVCCLVLMLDKNRIYTVQEVCEGLIADDMQGVNGFGYDPIVFLPQLNKTVAELSEAEKDRYSHRGKAGRQLARFLQQID